MSNSIAVQRVSPSLALPNLRGTKKQLGWAYKIRDEFCRSNPSAEILKSQIEAKYWIEHRSSLIGREQLFSLPNLRGTDKQVNYAQSIRFKFARAFSGNSKLLKSQIDAVFWIENRQLLEFAILGFQSSSVSQEVKSVPNNGYTLTEADKKRHQSAVPPIDESDKCWAKIRKGISNLRSKNQ